MLTTDSLKLRGDIEIQVNCSKTGKLLKKIRIRNTITYDGSNSVLYLLSQDGIIVTDYRITELHIGTDTTPPTRGDLGLGADIFTSTLTAGNRTVVPASGELVITCTIGAGDANGNTITECGLFLGNGWLFARQIHTPIIKSNTITITYTWRVASTA